MGRPRMYDEALRERLIEEARSMLSKDGYHGVSLRVLTKNVGTSTNAVYTLFGSKEALMAEGVVRDLDDKMASHPLNDAADARTNLFEFARAYRSHAVADPRTFHGTFEAMEEARRPGSLTDRINPEVKNISAKIYQPLIALCEQIAEDFPGSNLDPANMATALWAVIHGFIALEIAGALPLESEEAEELFNESLESLYLGWTLVRTPDIEEGVRAVLDRQAAQEQGED